MLESVDPFELLPRLAATIALVTYLLAVLVVATIITSPETAAAVTGGLLVLFGGWGLAAAVLWRFDRLRDWLLW